MKSEQKTVDLISSLIFATVWTARRMAEGESGTKARAMVKQKAGHLFTMMTSRQPTEEELGRMLSPLNAEDDG